MPLVKGVRRLIQALCRSARLVPAAVGFIEGIRLLPKYGFSFDLCIFHSQMADTIELVRRCPEVSFILDHIGKPGIKANIREPWWRQMRELASLPNVICKISGVVNEDDHKTWTYDRVAPYIAHAIECFGRIGSPYGGDWPVARAGGELSDWVDVVDRVTAGSSSADLHKLYRTNAIRFYRLLRHGGTVMNSSVRVAAVGCGFFAGNHFNSWNDLRPKAPNSSRSATSTPRRPKARRRSSACRSWYTDFDEMLAKEKIDLLDVITRMDTHRMLVEKSIGKKIATIVQKPFAPDWKDAVAMTSAAEKAGVFLAVHENFRFQAPLMRVKRVRRFRRDREPSWARISFRTGYDIYSGQPYFYDEMRFIILDLGIHTLDVARYLLGEVELVSCQTQRRNPKVKAEDTVTAILRHTSGAVSVNDFTYESRQACPIRSRRR